ncbi:MAG TPA: hypothetical protein PLV70_05105 [Flavobacteriales bacterium]|nr:hypothetical protein [Flavobacteriales bacterium]HRN35396.1 hypothetical protein [Flavobacteriales bacterium]HRO39389.1 hypothetical protein [Flavobacteriales bacterium]HRP81980.1 hypothetical protein [Flavobacteriales bacterium]HRQ84472.1 hypothetical protein [Flavobacteriales bacterium]
MAALCPWTVWGGAAIIAALPLAACQSSGASHDKVVAVAYKDKLYWADLRAVVPVTASPEDSAAIARRYMDNWARDRVMLHMAEQNLDKAQINLEAQLKAYRESLLTFAYEQALVAQNLDTVVTGSQIQDYYDKNIANFELKDNFVRVRWFKIRGNDKKQLRQTEQFWRSNDPADLHKLELMLARTGVSITDTHDDWLEFSTLQQQVPMRPTNPTDWLQHQKKVVVEDTTGTYFVHFLDHRLKDSTSPIDLVEGQIRSIIINRRKLQLVERMREELYANAVANKDISFP